MPSFTQSRRQEAIAYDESVTRLRASDLIEEGTRCPICYTEIASFARIYLHRGCANIVCSSCFESNLSQVIDSDICLICKGHLAEPCIENAIPNWRFTYTHIPLPASFGHSSSKPGPPLSPQHGFDSGGNGWPGSSARSTYNTAEGFGGLSAAIGRLKADIAEQRKIMRDLRGKEFPNQDNNNRSLRQGNTNPRNQKNWYPWYQDNNNSESQNAYSGYQNNNFHHQNNSNSWLENDNYSRPWYNRSPWNQHHSNPRNANGSDPGPRPHPTARNQHNINLELGNGTYPRGQKRRDSEHQKKQQGKRRGFYWEGLHPALVHHYSDSQAQSQHQRRHQHARNRRPRRKQPYHQGQNRFYLTLNNPQGPSMFPTDNLRHALGNGGNPGRLRGRPKHDGVRPPRNINQNLKHTRNFPAGINSIE